MKGDSNIPYIDRINELARKAKTVGLTEEEIDERNGLRKRYIEAIKSSVKDQLENIEFIEDDPEKP